LPIIPLSLNAVEKINASFVGRVRRVLRLTLLAPDIF
jgi:hypothetical protein